MISGGPVRYAVGMGAAILLGSGWFFPVQGGEDDCSRWVRLGREEAARAEHVRQTQDPDALIEHLEKARDAFAKAMKACPDSAKASWVQVQSRLAYSRCKKGAFGDACDAYAELLEFEPARSVDRALYADALEQSGHYKEAVEQFKILIQSDPKRSAFYCNAAMIYGLGLGDGAQAVETAQKGVAEAGPEPCLEFAWGKGLAVSGVRMLKTPDAAKGLRLLEDAKLKFAALEDDSDYGAKARAEIRDIDQRIQGDQGKKAREKR